jgi:Tol biopolymer transport system component
MRILAKTLLCLAAVLPLPSAEPKTGPEYTADGRLKFPENYRQWVYLSTGIGMTYGPLAEQQTRGGPPMFDNIFVNPEAYRAFLETGHWPDKTILVMEARLSESHASINNGGHFQTDIVGVEAEVKDSSTAEGPWNFYGFQVKPGEAPEAAKAVSHKSGCYGCHGVKTAVENTFVQFYPPLYDAAERKGTFNAGFEKLAITPLKLFAMIRDGGWSKGVIALEDAAKRSPDATVMNMEALNQLAYRLMGSNLVGDSVKLLQWTAARYPTSANLQDSLAEASERFGTPGMARAASERALKLLPDDKALPAARRDRVMKAVDERLKRLGPSTAGAQWPTIQVHGGAPAVAPDGSRIVFASERGGASNFYAVQSDGSAEVQLTQGNERKSAPVWDSRNRRLLFSVWADGKSAIYSMDPVDKNPHQIGAAPARNPAVSPDGKWAAYSNHRIYVAAIDGSQEHPITEGVALEFDPVWSPDGKQIAFVRSGGPDRKMNIWVMNADGSGQRQLTHIVPEEGKAEWPVWSPDGRQIAMQVGEYSPQKSIAHIWIADAATGEARKLAPHAEAYTDEMPAWFPDGKRLAFQSTRTGRMEVWAMNADGSGARQVTR